jgi:hypothetical protein
MSFSWSRLRELGVGFVLLLLALSCLLPYHWLVGPPRDVFWRYWLLIVLAPLFVLYWIQWPGCLKPRVLLCCACYWLLVSLLTNLQLYSMSSTMFCLDYHATKLTDSSVGTAYNVFLVGPPVSGCESLSHANVQLDPPQSAYVTSYWETMNNFDLVVRPDWNWTLMSVSCRGRAFPACNPVPSLERNLTDWRQRVPGVPAQPLSVVCFVLVAHVVVFAGVQLGLYRAQKRRGPGLHVNDDYNILH